MAYDNKNGVKYSRWDSDGDEYGDEPDVQETDAVLEELYFSPHSGKIEITVMTESDGFIAIDIPVLPVKSWRKFVESLPMWE